MSIHEKLTTIQSQLKAPKNQTNKFGGYKYRSCEDILEAVKPLLKEHGMHLTISDEIVEVGGRVYVKATAMVTDGESNGTATTQAFAREAEQKKGMDEAQITGSASSYARKYALNGLFCIDDTKDSDATNDHGKTTAKPPSKKGALSLTAAMEMITSCTSQEQIETTRNSLREFVWAEQEAKSIKECIDNRLATLRS